MIDKDDLVDTLKGFFGRVTSEAIGDFMPPGTQQVGAPRLRGAPYSRFTKTAWTNLPMTGVMRCIG
jgi:hypothetical protein